MVDAAKPKYQKTYPQYAKEYGVTKRTIIRWAKQGYPLDDPAAMPEKLGLQKNAPGSQHAGPVVASKELKLRLECEKLAFNLAVAKGEYTANPQIREDLTRIASATRAALMRLENDLPGVLAGLDESAIQKKLREQIDEIMRELSSSLNQLYLPPACPPSP